MQHYEIILIVDINQPDRMASLRQRYRDVVDSFKGKVHRFEDWGLRRLSYPIGGCKDATYLLYNIEAPLECVHELGRQFRANDTVIRNLVLRRDRAITEKSIMLDSVERQKTKSAASEERSSDNSRRGSRSKSSSKSSFGSRTDNSDDKGRQSAPRQERSATGAAAPTDPQPPASDPQASDVSADQNTEQAPATATKDDASQTSSTS